MKRSHGHQLYLIAVVLLAFFLRFRILGQQNIAFDEGFSIAVARKSWPILFRAILSDGVHPPLFYAVFKAALGWYGFTEFGARFGIAILSVAGVAALYRLGRDVFSPGVGLAAAIFLAVNPIHIWLAQEARMYSLLSLLITLNMWLFWHLINRRNRFNWSGFATTAALIYLTHYFGLLVPIIQFTFIALAFKRYHKMLIPWLAGQIAAGIILLPWLALTAMRTTKSFGIGFLVIPSPIDILLTLWNMLSGIDPQLWFLAAPAIILGSIGAGLALRNAQQNRFAQLALLWASVPILMVWLMSQQRSFYADRYLSFTIPALLLLIAWGISHLPRQKALAAGVILTGLLLVSHLAQFNSVAYQKDHWRKAADHITQKALPDDIILLRSPHIQLPFGYYYQGQGEQKLSSFNTISYDVATLTDPARRTWVVMPYTRRPTHYPMQPATVESVWQLDDDAQNLETFVSQNQARILDNQRFLGVEIWLIDCLR